MSDFEKPSCSKRLVSRQNSESDIKVAKIEPDAIKKEEENLNCQESHDGKVLLLAFLAKLLKRFVLSSFQMP